MAASGLPAKRCSNVQPVIREIRVGEYSESEPAWGGDCEPCGLLRVTPCSDAWFRTNNRARPYP
jgi:hypothetical protein